MERICDDMCVDCTCGGRPVDWKSSVFFIFLKETRMLVCSVKGLTLRILGVHVKIELSCNEETADLLREHLYCSM